MPDPITPPATTSATEPPAATPPPAENLLTPDPASPAPGSAEPVKLEVPEKFKAADGTLNQDALLKSYTELEKRLGTGDAPPKTPDEYKLDYKLPEGVTVDKEAEKSFLASCHAQGMTNKQVQFVMDKYAGILGEQAKTATVTKEQAITDLKTAWGDKFDENMTLARKAFAAIADEADRAELQKQGNNPAFLRMLAKIGANLKEDTPPIGSPLPAGSDDEIQALMRSPAYWNAKDPEHLNVKAKVEAYHKAKFEKRAS